MHTFENVVRQSGDMRKRSPIHWPYRISVDSESEKQRLLNLSFHQVRGRNYLQSTTINRPGNRSRRRTPVRWSQKPGRQSWWRETREVHRLLRTQASTTSNGSLCTHVDSFLYHPLCPIYSKRTHHLFFNQCASDFASSFSNTLQSSTGENDVLFPTFQAMLFNMADVYDLSWKLFSISRQ